MQRSRNRSDRELPFWGRHEEAGHRLVDQYITVRVLTRVVTTLIVVAVTGWWFLFDEVKSVSRDMALQRSELVREISLNGAFQVEQRNRLWDRVNELQRDIQSLQGDVSEVRAGVQHIGRTTDSIFAVMVSDRDGVMEVPE